MPGRMIPRPGRDLVIFGPDGRDPMTGPLDPFATDKGVDFTGDSRGLSLSARLRVGMLVFCAIWGVFTFRSIDLAMMDPSIRQVATVAENTVRGDIMDRHGRLLATNIETISLGINPSAITDAAALSAQLAEVFPTIDAAKVKHLASGKGKFAVIRRDISRRQEREILWRGIPGVEFQRRYRRIYPYGRMMSHIVGFTNMDGQGQSGIERTMDGVLAHDPVRLTIDARFQHALHAELSATLRATGATGASGVILDTTNGAIAAMVSLPDFDPHHPYPDGKPSPSLFNRAISGVYEVGSSLKLFTAAMALESGASLDDSYDVGTPLRVGRRVVRDYHPRSGSITLGEVIQHSSNIGAARIGLAVGGSAQKQFLRRFGFFDSLAVEIAEKSHPLVPVRWGNGEVISVSFGYGMALSPLHIASASVPLVNGGIFFQPTLLAGHDNAHRPQYRIISEETSFVMRQMMRKVVHAGTGSRARSAYDIGGKTGTANMITAKGYDRDRNIVSFLGAFPMIEPRYVVFVLIESPNKEPGISALPTGGRIAAPVVRKIVERIAPLEAVSGSDGSILAPIHTPIPPIHTPIPAISPILPIPGVENVAVIRTDR